MSTPETKRDNLRYQAQDILARRDHSEFEVRTKLARKGFSEEQIDDAVAFLKERKLLSDERFAAAYVENTLRFKAVGPAWLIMKLQQKGVARDCIEPAVFDQLPPEREEELARAAAKRRLARQRSGGDRERMKLQRFLVQRGFSFDVVERVTEELMNGD